MADNCGNIQLNPSVPCDKLDGQIAYIFLITKGLNFAADQDTAKLKATVDALIQSGDVIPFPKLKTLENQSTGAAYEDSPLGRTTVSNGQIIMLANIEANSELYTKIESFTGASGYDIFFLTDPGSFIFHKNEDDSLGGFSLDNFNVENPTLNDGAVAEKAPINITLDDINEWRKERVVFRPSYNAKRLRALSDVVIEIVGTPTSTEVKFKAYLKANNTDVQSANPVQGFVDGDLSFLTAAGASQTIGGGPSGGDAAANYIYTITGTGLVTGTLGLKDPSLMTTSGYNGTNLATVTIA